MWKYRIRTFLLICLALQPWGLAQSGKAELFDGKRSRNDLEVMRGILRTTLGQATKELRGAETDTEREFFHQSWGLASINAYYLYGQGAIFTIPASAFFNSLVHESEGPEAYTEAEAHYSVMQTELAKVQEEMIRAQAERSALEALAAARDAGGGVSGRVVVPTPRLPPPLPPPQNPPEVPAPAVAATPQVAAAPAVAGPEKEKVKAVAKAAASDEQAMRQRLERIQERSKRQRETMEQRRAKFKVMLTQLKGPLIEALANHGDSLTQVKPGEYITLIITEDSRTLSNPQLLSVQKSAITDYKSGRLTLETFRSKVLDYTN